MTDNPTSPLKMEQNQLEYVPPGEVVIKSNVMPHAKLSSNALATHNPKDGKMTNWMNMAVSQAALFTICVWSERLLTDAAIPNTRLNRSK